MISARMVKNVAGRMQLVFALVVLILVTCSSSTASQDCSSGSNGYTTLPCNQDLDPWKNTRTKMDTLTNQVDPPVFNLWTRAKYGKEKVDTIVNTPEKLSKAAQALQAARKVEVTEAAKKTTETAEKVAEQAKGAKKWMQKASKMLSTLSAVAQFAGPIIDIVLLFSPLSKSSELTAIESGFAKVGAQIDSVAYQISKIQDALEWNAIVGFLLKFEGSVDHATYKYDQLVLEIKAMDTTQEMPLAVKNQIEDLVNAIRDPSDIGNSLQLVDNIWRGKSGFTNGKTLLETFVSATDNDCSEILPLANKIMKTVKDAQRLQYFYEINQKLTTASDDKGYPKMLYDMYLDSIAAYTKCTKNAAEYARDQMKRSVGAGKGIIAVIDEMEPKYDLYNWAAMKEADKEDDRYAFTDNCGSTREVTLAGLSDDDQKKQRLTLFGVKKSSNKEVEDAVSRVKIVLVGLKKADLPVIDVDDRPWNRATGEFRMKKLDEIKALLKKDKTLKDLIESDRLTMIMFKDDAQIDLHGWHYKSNMEVLERERSYGPAGSSSSSIVEKFAVYTLGFIFNFKDNETFECVAKQGDRIDMSFEGSHPHCVCKMGFGNTGCNMTLAEDSSGSLSSNVLDLIKVYKVPGMFDLQSEVRKGTETVMKELENTKQEIFKEVRKTSQDREKTKNAILSAQSVMLNDIKAGNAVVLKEVAGLKEAMDAAFERERNDRIYQTEKGNKIVISTIKDANRKVTDDINRLTGQVIQNRYFKELKLNIPVFQEKFERAIDYGGIAEQDFSQYMERHELDFQTSKLAAYKGVVETTDSFVTAQMQISMVSGCTADYKAVIDSTWNEMFELNLAVSTMEMWDLDYQIKNTKDQDRVAFFKHEQAILKKKCVADSEELKSVYESRSCPAFSLASLAGGGCAKSLTYPGQRIPVRCSDATRTLVLASTGQAVTDVVCQSAGQWEVNVGDLACVKKCMTDGEYFDVGETRQVPTKEIGYRFVDVDGNAVTQTTCLAPREPGWNAPTTWTPITRETAHEVYMKKDSLEIKTDSALGSGDLVNITFQTSTLAPAGGLKLSFDSDGKVYYELLKCQSNKAALTLPAGGADDTRTWTISRDPATMVIACNGVDAVRFDLTTCDHGDKAEFREMVGRVVFAADDTASDSYRVKKVKDCVADDDTKGANYRGKIAVTESGRQCQRWDSQVPNKFHGPPSFYVGLTENYCRNTDGTSYVWCYNSESKLPRFELCAVPRCSASDEDMIRAEWGLITRQDIDECADADFCRFGGTCNNSEGSFTCTCPSGYKIGADGKCEDVNECDVGNVGYTSCLVHSNLGQCTNTPGSYRCKCLSGSWTPTIGGKECRVCNCDDNGVQSTTCDVNTGTCLCITNVVGARCDACRSGIASFPMCTRCAPGYYNYPTCTRCNCAAEGVTSQVCDPNTGRCLCKSHVGGSRCDSCSPTYKNYPSCIPDRQDGTLTQWSAWSNWVDLSKCGASYVTDISQKRTRSRTCDNSTKNVHGKSCSNEQTDQQQTRYEKFCSQISLVFINLPGLYHAGTTADLWMGIKQDSIRCTTSRPTWRRPGAGSKTRAGSYIESASGCSNTFDIRYPVSLYLYSDSNNDVYIKHMGVTMKTTGKDKIWKSPGSYTAIDHDTNNGWHTTST